jgi:hypothetical protein
MRLANRILASALALAAVFGASALQARVEGLPQERVQGSIAYISGGIGADEATALRKAAASYPLTLELAAPGDGPRDEYVADATVGILDRQGRPVLSATAEGPLVLIRLPSGRYAVEVTWNGVVKRKTVDIATGKRLHVVFAFAPENSPR